MLNFIIYIFIILFFCTMLCYKVRIRKPNNGYDLDKYTTNVLKGYSILLIIIHHMVLRMDHPSILLPFRKFGYLGVAIFFFLSGYGLVCSARKREKEYSNGFMKKRLKKVYFPAVLAQVIYMLILVLGFNVNYSVLDFIKGALSLYPIDTSQWYVIAIFFWYITFWILLKIKTSWNKRIISLLIAAIVYIIVCELCEFTNNWVYTSFCFTFGVSFSVYKDKCIEIIHKHWILLPIALLTTGVAAFFSQGTENNFTVALMMISSITFVVFVLMVLRFVDISKNKLIEYIGTISLECYLIHGKVIRVISNCFENINGKECIIYLITTALATAIFVMIIKNINKLNFFKN